MTLVRLLICLALTAICAANNGHIKLLQTNDDGWAVANIRAQNNALIAAGFDVVLSSPAENESGTGSSDAPAEALGSTGCEFDSCPPDAPATGFNASNPRLNYVNSFPVTSVRFGIQEVSPKFFHGSGPDFVVSGPNVGNNLGNVTLESGTVGAACEAAKEGFPSVAFSGGGGSQISFTTLNTSSASTTTALTFAVLGRKFTEAILATPFSVFEPILPRNVTMNVNYPSASGACADPDAFRFVLSRINAAASGAAPDVRTCGTDRLPTESSVVATTPGCFVSVSVMNAVTKDDVDAVTQAFVLRKLSRFLTCLP